MDVRVTPRSSLKTSWHRSSCLLLFALVSWQTGGPFLAVSLALPFLPLLFSPGPNYHWLIGCHFIASICTFDGIVLAGLGHACELVGVLLQLIMTIVIVVSFGMSLPILVFDYVYYLMRRRFCWARCFKS